MTTKDLIQELSSKTAQSLEFVTQHFKRLSSNQRNWKKDANSWSINETFAHLNAFATYYHATFLYKFEITKFKQPSDEFISSPLGRSAWKSMKLGNAKNIKRKFNAIRNMNPRFNEELAIESSVEDFEKNIFQMTDIIERAATVNLRKVKIPISFSKIVRLRLGDALLYVVYHNERHIQQALNQVNHPQFPEV